MQCSLQKPWVNMAGKRSHERETKTFKLKCLCILFHKVRKNNLPEAHLIHGDMVKSRIHGYNCVMFYNRIR